MGFTPVQSRVRCVKTVSKPLLLGALGIYLSEKQMPQVVGFISSGQNQWESWSRTRCAQGRCATRLRYAPTLLAPLILNYFRGRQATHNARPWCNGVNPYSETVWFGKLCRGGSKWGEEGGRVIRREVSSSRGSTDEYVRQHCAAVAETRRASTIAVQVEG